MIIIEGYGHMLMVGEKKPAVGIDKKINCTSINNSGILIQVIRKKNFNIQTLAMLDFLKEPIITQIGKMILATSIMFLKHFGTK